MSLIWCCDHNQIDVITGKSAIEALLHCRLRNLLSDAIWIARYDKVQPQSRHGSDERSVKRPPGEPIANQCHPDWIDSRRHAFRSLTADTQTAITSSRRSANAK